MPVKQSIAEFHGQMTEWRQSIHANPETGYEEERTSDMVAKLLGSFGVEVHKGMAKTGVVGVLRGKHAIGGTIGLRADMDALHIAEQTNLPYRSRVEGKMHACGHDGHTAMLLGAAKYLAATRDFSGTVYFIFQPAEEAGAGGKRMIGEGLFRKFPMDAVYGLHNWPGLPVGAVAARSGAMMAASDVFEIRIVGQGGHAALPHQATDPVAAAAQCVIALQSITSRNTDPLEALVISVTQFQGGQTFNIIPETVEMRGTARSFDPDLRERIEPMIRRVVEGVCSAHGTTAEMKFHHSYPATINHEHETGHAAAAAGRVVGTDNVRGDIKPCMGAEDFAYMLQEKPGSYIWLGAGEERAGLHSPYYDFNDEVLPIGASYWAELVEGQLPTGS
ncbi:MAG: M20 aminoacylase family protein [Hyphomicrobiales bacterium]